MLYANEYGSGKYIKFKANSFKTHKISDKKYPSRFFYIRKCPFLKLHCPVTYYTCFLSILLASPVLLVSPSRVAGKELFINLQNMYVSGSGQNITHILP